jgi:LacI family transcriptional regulator
MSAPRVLVVLDTLGAWSRGILRGFASVAHEQGWTLLHYHPNVNLDWASAELRADAVVFGPGTRGPWPASFKDCLLVAVNSDRSAEGIPSVCLDEARVAELAATHFLSRGFRNLTSFRFNDWPFGALRERFFAERVAQAGARLDPPWWADGATPPRSHEHPELIEAWLRGLRKPCAVFACCDGWGRIVARYARLFELRVPDDIALLGVDNDVVECELMAPPLSSVAVPWRNMGDIAARLVLLGLRGKTVRNNRVLVSPIDVVTRRSSDTFAIDDPIVAKGVAWIHAHAHRRFTVPMVASAAGVPRQRLERHFRRALGRSVMEEARRVHVDVARRLLATTELPLAEVARQSGFTNPALLSVAFNREAGMPPGAYRRSARGAIDADE